MDFTFLPAEMIEEVASYLSLDDIRACSVVNSQWRRAFDKDIIWKRFCTFHKSYFDKQATKLIDTSRYSDCCSSKRKLFQELQVEQNLIKGKYDAVRIDIGEFYCCNLVDTVDEVGNHWLFISCASSLKTSPYLIQVWNMNNYPAKHQVREIPLGGTKRPFVSEMRVFKNRLYYSVDDFLTAFEFSHPNYNLIVLFNISCHNYLKESDLAVWVCRQNMVLGFVYSSSHDRLSAEPWVYIWGEDQSLLYKNYSNKTVDQVRSAHEITDRRPSVVVKEDSASDNVLLAYSNCSIWSRKSTVVLFDINRRQYAYFSRKENRVIISCELANKMVVLCCCDVIPEHLVKLDITILCCSTDGDVIYTHRIGKSYEYIHNVLITDEGKKVVLLNHNGKVTVFDGFQQREISSFKIGNGDNLGAFIKNNLMLVQQPRSKKTNLEMWDIIKEKRLYAFDELQPNKSPNTESVFYRFSFKKSSRSPTKLFAIMEPQNNGRFNNEIVVISFM